MGYETSSWHEMKDLVMLKAFVLYLYISLFLIEFTSYYYFLHKVHCKGCYHNTNAWVPIATTQAISMLHLTCTNRDIMGFGIE